MTSDQGEFDMNPTESETTGTVGNFSHGSRETPATSAAPMAADRSEKARRRTSDMHVTGESDRPIVPKKLANNGGPVPPAESVEGRGLTKESTWQLLLARTPSRNARSRGLPGVRDAGTEAKHRLIRGRSRMREIRSYGSVRGVARKGHPYRDKIRTSRRPPLHFSAPDVSANRSHCF
jgi:hypothetical protein